MALVTAKLQASFPSPDLLTMGALSTLHVVNYIWHVESFIIELSSLQVLLALVASDSLPQSSFKHLTRGAQPLYRTPHAYIRDELQRSL